MGLDDERLGTHVKQTPTKDDPPKQGDVLLIVWSTSDIDFMIIFDVLSFDECDTSWRVTVLTPVGKVREEWVFDGDELIR